MLDPMRDGKNVSHNFQRVTRQIKSIIRCILFKI